MIQTNIVAAREEIQSIIGPLTASPTIRKGKGGILLSGKPKAQGVLGVISDKSNLDGGGGGGIEPHPELPLNETIS